MQLPVDEATALISQIEGGSLLIGLTLGATVMGIILLIISNKLQRSRLLLSMRLEQAEKHVRQLEQEVDHLDQQTITLQKQNRELFRDNVDFEARLRETRTIARERATLFQQTKEQMEEDFANLSRKTLAEQGRVLRDQHADGLRGLLQPMREQLDGFKQKVETVYDSESKDRVSLINEIEQLKSLNERISHDAVQLTRALKGKNKLQGQWGEMLLEKLLEDSGLRPGQEFETQVTLRDDNGRLKQPDVVIHLPGKRDIVIDAKVSLVSYLAACSAENSKERQNHVNALADSVRKHVRDLSGKEYQHLPGLTTVDFVLLFIPVEGAFQAAISANQELLTRAMKQKVIVSGPSTLLAILRTIHHMWRLDEQNSNGLQIAKEAGNLYDKFVGFVEAFDEIGTRLNQATQSWHVAEKRLATGQGNLISRTNVLKKLGVQPTKKLAAKRQPSTIY